MTQTPSPASCVTLRRRFDNLDGRRKALRAARESKAAELLRVGEYLAIAPQVEQALATLSQLLFQQLTGVLETTLTYALQEILGQSITLKAEQQFKRGGVTISFHIERDGFGEDILKGQGGSVANILSVGLRLFALSRLDESRHRKFLVLDEQDCWLAPELVPRLVRIVHDAASKLGFQVLMISHHDTRSFDQFADRIYEFAPTPDGVTARLLQSHRRARSEQDPD